VLVAVVLDTAATVVLDSCGAEADLRLALHSRCPLLLATGGGAGAAGGSAVADHNNLLLGADGDAGTIEACGGGASEHDAQQPALKRGYAGVVRPTMRLGAGEYWLLVSSDGEEEDGDGDVEDGATAAPFWQVRASCDGVAAAPAAATGLLEPCARWRDCGACVATETCGWCARTVKK